MNSLRQRRWLVRCIPKRTGSGEFSRSQVAIKALVSVGNRRAKIVVEMEIKPG